MARTNRERSDDSAILRSREPERLHDPYDGQKPGLSKPLLKALIYLVPMIVAFWLLISWLLYRNFT
jgi:hypothetical protein